MTTWAVPDWALTPLSYLTMGVVVLALVVGLSVIAFCLLWVASGMLAKWLNLLQNTKLMLFAAWWRANGGKVPQTIWDVAMQEQMQYPTFRASLRKKLQDAEDEHD